MEAAQFYVSEGVIEEAIAKATTMQRVSQKDSFCDKVKLLETLRAPFREKTPKYLPCQGPAAARSNSKGSRTDGSPERAFKERLQVHCICEESRQHLAISLPTPAAREGRCPTGERHEFNE